MLEILSTDARTSSHSLSTFRCAQLHSEPNYSPSIAPSVASETLRLSFVRSLSAIISYSLLSRVANSLVILSLSLGQSTQSETVLFS